MGKKNEREGLRLTLEKLYRCRDLEISNLWQRSVFLSVFIILCFTAYGYLVIEMIKCNSCNFESYLKYNSVCILICCISIIFSLIWILMSKSSKAWYEVYETAIRKFEIDYHTKIGLPVNYIMGNMSLPKGTINNNITSTNGGAFSPSRINIFIGQISLYLWTIAIVIHTIHNYVLLKEGSDVFYTVLTTSLPLITIITVLLIMFTKTIRSTFL